VGFATSEVTFPKKIEREKTFRNGFNL